jgi:predicted transcriptional regulator
MVNFDDFENGEIFSPLQKDLISYLSSYGPSTRAQIIKELKKPRTTIYDNLMGLISYNIVKKYSRPTNYRGRPLVFFRICEGN